MPEAWLKQMWGDASLNKYKMKHLIIKQTLLFCFLFSTIHTFAQSDTSKFHYFDKGHNVISPLLSTTIGSEKLVGINVGVRYGRFIMNKFCVGLQVNFNHADKYFQAGGVQPFARYYILNRKLSPFFEANYSYGLSKQNNGGSGTDREEWTGISNAVYAGTGLAYTGIFKLLGIELYGGYRYSTTVYKNLPPNFNTHNYVQRSGFAYGLRINFYF